MTHKNITSLEAQVLLSNAFPVNVSIGTFSSLIGDGDIPGIKLALESESNIGHYYTDVDTAIIETIADLRKFNAVDEVVFSSDVAGSVKFDVPVINKIEHIDVARKITNRITEIISEGYVMIEGSTSEGFPEATLSNGTRIIKLTVHDLSCNMSPEIKVRENGESLFSVWKTHDGKFVETIDEHFADFKEMKRKRLFGTL